MLMLRRLLAKRDDLATAKPDHPFTRPGLAGILQIPCEALQAGI
jgi:hypothetical protein